MSRKISPPLNLYKKIAIFFIVVSFILVVGVFYFSLTYAFVDVEPNKTIVERDFSFIVQADSEKKDLSRGIFVGTLVEEVVEAEGAFDATGIQTKESAVTGKMNIKNNFSVDQPLIATTRFLSEDGVLFRLSDNVEVPAGGSIQADVYIDDETVETNISLGDKFTIPGLNQAKQELIYGEAAASFSGNAIVITVVSEEDIENAKQALFKKAKQKFNIDTSDSDKISIVSTEIIESTIEPALGQEAVSFIITAQISVRGVSVDRLGVESYVTNLLEGTLSDDQEIMNVSTDDLELKISKIESDQKIAQLDGTIKGFSIVREGARILSKSKLAGLGSEEVIAFLQNLEEVKSAEVTFFPFWIKKIPQFEDHIIIRINN